MRRVGKFLAWSLAVVVGFPVVLAGALLLAANTDPGRHGLERLAGWATSGMIRIDGISGRFPDAVRIRQLAVADAAGEWVVLDDVALDWSPTRLARSEAEVALLAAEKVELRRLPASSGEASAGSTGYDFILPVTVRLGRLHVGQLVVAAPIAGQAMTLTVDGHGWLASSRAGDLHVTAAVPGRAADAYAVDLATAGDRLDGTVRLREDARGLVSGLANLPEIGAIDASVTLAGLRTALATDLKLSAGPLSATATGTLDIDSLSAKLSVAATAPPMTPRPGLGWQAVSLKATVDGPLAAPTANGTLAVTGLEADGATLKTLTAQVSGTAGEIRAQATLEGLALPGAPPDLLGTDPVRMEAKVGLAAPGRPVELTVSHPLLRIDGTARTAGEVRADLTIDLPRLAPLAAAGGAGAEGSATLKLAVTQTAEAIGFDLDGRLAVTGGMAPLPDIVGKDATLALSGRYAGGTLSIDSLRATGQGGDAAAKGTIGTDSLSLDWDVRLKDVATLHPTLSGPLMGRGTLKGAFADLIIAATLDGEIAAKGFRSGRFQARIDATGLPSAIDARIALDGTLLEAPAQLAMTVTRRGDSTQATLDRSTWKSITAQGKLTLVAPATLPEGQMDIRIGNLDDLSPLAGRRLRGEVTATLDSTATDLRLRTDVARLDVQDGGSLATGKLDARLRDPQGRAELDATMALDGLVAGSARGNVRLTAKGPADKVAIALNADMASAGGAPARATADALLDGVGRSLALAALKVDTRGQTVRLLAPARIGFADDITIDRLRLGLRQAELSVAGRIGAQMNLTASLRAPADIAAIVDPAYAADGSLTAEARLTGSTAAPMGTVDVKANGLRLRTGPGRGLPAANITTTLTLRGTSAGVDARLGLGSSRLDVTGTVPLSATGPMDVRARGTLDLALTDPILTAQGRRVRGKVDLDAGISGTIAAPVARGTARLGNGDVQDYPLGLHLADITAQVEADGTTIRLSRLTAKAGTGTVEGSGTVSLAGDMPVSVKLRALRARPVATDIVTALVNADLSLEGALGGQLTLGGRIVVPQADIRIPERLPSSVATIPVRVAGAPVAKAPTVPARPAPPLALALTVSAPEQIFVRGRGVDAELGGRIVLGGTVAEPLPTGGLTLRRGTISFAGQTLNLTEGTVDFTGGGLANPSLHLVATQTTQNLTARVAVDGSARDPKITLSSTPEMPPDEVLAQLLFNSTTARLSPFQIAQIASALASLSGGPSLIDDPLEGIRSRLGLDRLTVGTGANGQPTLEAGSYVARGVYVGARQSASGNGTQATVQVDLARGLKLDITAGSANTSATGSSGAQDAASVGLTYQFEY